jgi:hypothetical protein
MEPDSPARVSLRSLTYEACRVRGDLLLQQLAALGPIGGALVPPRIFPSALRLHRRGVDTVLILPQYRCRGEVKRQDSVSSLRRTPFAVQAWPPLLLCFLIFPHLFLFSSPSSPASGADSNEHVAVPWGHASLRMCASVCPDISPQPGTHRLQ